jgi:Mce-associated membrane protein
VEPVIKKPSGARKWLSNNRKTVATAAIASFVAAGAFAGAAAQPYLMDRATVATKLKIARTAADAINTLWSYTPENMDKLPDRSARYLGGDFEEQYRKYVDAIAATNKQAKVTSNTKVVGTAVESLRGSEATAIVYTNTTSTTPQSNDIPSMKYLSYRLDMKRYGRDWRVTKMSTVTSLDLTPKLGF